MRKTFICDESMIITIPIGSLKNIQEGQLMPENFHCVFRDNFKVFVVRGKPKPLGAAQAFAGVLIFTLGFISMDIRIIIFSATSIVFFFSGLASFAAGICPDMHVIKLSFSLNIISFFWSLVAFGFYVFLCILDFFETDWTYKFLNGIIGLIITLLVFECMMALFLIYWQSKAVCREHFNTLPIITLKQEDSMMNTEQNQE
ncbi:membrane-spanning 4-domains subfamily A member 4D [Poeciliopsis prolifica]|uniref:membrane-spanning 4-domains subfamily A member 4D n=1 Tax=Poeciliopsis prolifica TaxID=188132 RepID=UPI0024137AE6|nr:membrane-spanning 4-domains subfamily A member 4D [Poeciliopsis prolifica]